MWTWNGTNCASSLGLFSVARVVEAELVAQPASVLLQSARPWRLFTTLLQHEANGFLFTWQREKLTSVKLIRISQIWGADDAESPLLFFSDHFNTDRLYNHRIQDLHLGNIPLLLNFPENLELRWHHYNFPTQVGSSRRKEAICCWFFTACSYLSILFLHIFIERALAIYIDTEINSTVIQMHVYGFYNLYIFIHIYMLL